MQLLALCWLPSPYTDSSMGAAGDILWLPALLNYHIHDQQTARVVREGECTNPTHSYNTNRIHTSLHTG